ncbi:MAG: tetratricopeptide repeat protein [Bacteroidia bacterium]|nr:MAG: tetratricopeptide repeat protein [Bacteroidia bacterium]
MSNKRKVVLIVIGGILGLMVLFFLLFSINKHQYSSKIPELPESQTLSLAVNDQISDALATAHRFPSSENLGMLGMVYHSSAYYEQAAQCYKLALKRNKSEWIWNYYLGFLNMEMGESESIIENFNSVIEKNPSVHHAWYYLGEEYKNLRKNELAEKSFSKISSIQNNTSVGKQASRYDYFPLGTYAMYQLARLYFDTDRLDLAELTLHEIIRNNRSFGPAYRLLGNIYNVNGDMPLGKRYGVRANDLVVFSPPVDTLVDRLVLLSRSELYLLKKIDEAEKSIYPEWAMTLVNVAMQYIPDNKYLISKAIRNGLMLGLDEQAAAYTDQHIRYFQDNFTEMNNMGILFFQKGLYPQSMKYLTRALDLKPQDADIQKSLAICYWTLGDKQKTHEILNGLVELNQDNPNLLADITSILFDLGEDEQAIGYLNRLKQLSPENPKVQKMAGALAEENGNYQEAVTLYESSFRNAPEDLATIRYLGNVLVRQKMWDKYIRHLRMALDYHPNDPYLLERLGTILVICPDPAWRDTNEGRDYSERAFIHTSSGSMTLISAGRSLALAYAELGDKQNANSIINMTINIARRESISQSYQKELESIARRIQTLDN